MSSRAAAFVIAALVTAALCGCASDGSDTDDGATARSLAGGSAPIDRGDPVSVTQGELLPSAYPIFEDLPVPMGFRMVESASTHTDGPGGRTVEHLFDGRAEIPQLDAFYRVRMPRHGWVLRSDGLASGVRVLRFESVSEACEVRIEPGRSRAGARLSRVHYSVHPRSAAGGA